MNKAIAKILLTRLDGANYLDRTSGIVQVITKYSEIEEGVNVAKRFPFADDATMKDAATMAKAMIPSSNYKSCLYFEDGGINLAPASRRTDYSSRIRCVCWLNMTKVLGYFDPVYTAKIQADVINRLTGVANFSDGFFSRMNVGVAGIAIQDANIFAGYDYNEQESQYLMPPFDFFAIDLDVSFSIAAACLEDFENAII